MQSENCNYRKVMEQQPTLPDCTKSPQNNQNHTQREHTGCTTAVEWSDPISRPNTQTFAREDKPTHPFFFLSPGSTRHVLQ